MTATPRIPILDAPRAAGLLAVLFNGAIFGFFFAWVCSTMWGLDAADPRVAIESMQAMNASVRNPTFAPAFFGTPFVLLGAAVVAKRTRHVRSARLFAAAAAIYFVGGVLLTVSMNLPLNRDLADVVVPDSVEAAQAIWDDYSTEWKFWNTVRTVFSGLSLAVAGTALANISVTSKQR